MEKKKSIGTSIEEKEDNVAEQVKILNDGIVKEKFFFKNISARAKEKKKYDERLKEIASKQSRGIVVENLINMLQKAFKKNNLLIDRARLIDFIDDDLINKIEKGAKTRLAKDFKRKFKPIDELQAYLGSKKQMISIILGD